MSVSTHQMNLQRLMALRPSFRRNRVLADQLEESIETVQRLLETEGRLQVQTTDSPNLPVS
jgi:hypothetical protein